VSKALALAFVVIALLILGVIFYQSNSSQNGNKEINLPTQIMEESSEMKIEEIKEGVGEEVKAGDTVEVHYTGTLTNGQKFDSSVDRDQTFSFTVGAGRVIQGWEQGLLGMKEGGVRKLTIPSSLGYGNQTVGPIPANSTLIFEIELISIN
jgi:FKBP-type peptidyl-prolyl cis-trans isomerase